MRILLVYVVTERLNMPVLPLGLASLGAAAEAAGHSVRFLNVIPGPEAGEALARAVSETRPEAVGVSVRNVDDQNPTAPLFLMEKARDAIAAIRSLTGAPIIVGGAGFTMFAAEALPYLGADYGVAGEGEAAFPAILARLERGESPGGLAGVLSRERPAAPPRLETDLDRFPLPLPRHLSVPEDWRGPDLYVPFQTRRGCAMDCSYCSTASIEGRRLRYRSPEKAVENLARYVAAGFSRFYFVDNTFNLPPSYALALCDAIIASNLAIEWRAIVYPRRVSPELVSKMARAGCREVSLGFESGVPSVLKRLNKKFSPEDIRATSALLAQNGIRRMGFLLLGGPGETRGTVQKSLDFAESLALESLKVTCGIRIYPKTLLERDARAEGVLAPGDGLLLPRFYMAQDIAGWLPETVYAWAKTRPWVLPA